MALPAWHGLGEGMSEHEISRMRKNTGLRACHNGRSAQALASRRAPRGPGPEAQRPSPARPPASPPGQRGRARARTPTPRAVGIARRRARRAAFSRARAESARAAMAGVTRCAARRPEARRQTPTARSPAAAATGHGLPVAVAPLPRAV